MEIKVLSPHLKNRLLEDNFKVAQLEAEVSGGTIRQAYDMAHEWLDIHYPHHFLRANLYNHQRDAAITDIVTEVNEILEPWIKTDCIDYLPVLTLKELARRTQLHPRHLIDTLRVNNPAFIISDQRFSLLLEQPQKSPHVEDSKRAWQRLQSQRDATLYNLKLSFCSI